jgi:hypothetical protein
MGKYQDRRAAAGSIPARDLKLQFLRRDLAEGGQLGSHAYKRKMKFSSK